MLLVIVAKESKYRLGNEAGVARDGCGQLECKGEELSSPQDQTTKIKSISVVHLGIGRERGGREGGRGGRCVQCVTSEGVIGRMVRLARSMLLTQYTVCHKRNY